MAPVTGEIYIPQIMAAKSTLHGRELSDAELARIRAEVEGFDTIEAIDDEMRELIADQWPHLLVKLDPPRRH